MRECHRSVAILPVPVNAGIGDVQVPGNTLQVQMQRTSSPCTRDMCALWCVAKKNCLDVLTKCAAVGVEPYDINEAEEPPVSGLEV